MPRLIALSDTHGMHRSVTVPNGDVLIHGGDMSGRGLWPEFVDFTEWFDAHPHSRKIMIFGNHDGYSHEEAKKWLTERHPTIHLLFDEAVKLDGVKYYGSPWTPEFFDWHFMKSRGKALKKTWAKIPEDVDVLITHGPPYGHGDLVPHPAPARAVGCVDLLNRLRRVRPRVHIFGHIHEGYGRTVSDEFKDTLFVNAATCTGDYKPTNPPQVINL